VGSSGPKAVLMRLVRDDALRPFAISCPYNRDGTTE
jgi:hypothetical protein